MAVRLTPVQLAVLRDVADPNVMVVARVPGLRGSWGDSVTSVGAFSDERRTVTAVIRRLETAGLVKLAPVGLRYHSPRPWSLTDAGREVLAEGKA